MYHPAKIRTLPCLGSSVITAQLETRRESLPRVGECVKVSTGDGCAQQVIEQLGMRPLVGVVAVLLRGASARQVQTAKSLDTIRTFAYLRTLARTLTPFFTGAMSRNRRSVAPEASSTSDMPIELASGNAPTRADLK